MKTPELQKLKDQLTLTENKRRKLHDQIEKAELEKKLPSLKKKYEGKFFKYRNSAGGGDKWWLYSFCREVLSLTESKFDSFESTPYNNEFSVNRDGYLSLFEFEISRKEYTDALIDFQSKCQLMMDNVFNHNA